MTSTETMVGARGACWNPTPESCALIKLEHPLLTDEELEKLAAVNRKGFQAATIPILFNVKAGAKGFGSRDGRHCLPPPTKPSAAGRQS